MSYNTNWQYGYTLGPPSEDNRGNYNTYYGQQGGQYQHQPPLPPGPSSAYSSDLSGGAFKAAAPQKRYTRHPGPRHSYQPPVTTTNPNLTVIPTVPSAPPAVRGPTSWSQIKAKTPAVPFQTKVFVTASSATPPVNQPPASTLSGVPTEAQKAADLELSCNQACATLHDLALFNKLTEKYEFTQVDKRFEAKLTLGDEVYKGTGTSQKAAKQNAAMQAMSSTKYSVKKTMRVRPSGTTATSELHELATKKGAAIDFKFLDPPNFVYHHAMKMWSKDEMRGNYEVQLTVADRAFKGYAEYPQEAKHNAAMEAIPFLRSLPDPNATVSLADTTTGGRVSLPDKNPIMALNEIAMSHGQTLVWGDGNVYGPPHQRRYEYTVTLAGHEAKGSGQNKKTAKAAAAVYLLAMLPPELRAPAPKKKQGKKRKAAAATGAAAAAGTEAKMIGPQIPGKIAKNSVSGMKVFEVIENANPISALHEYCMKAKLDDPSFDCISENVLETWQKDNRTFKKTEYTIALVVDGKTYHGIGNTKKKAKNAVAEEAWNVIRAGTFK